MDKVAIILPTLNVMPHIKSMIEALYNSTNFPFKLIIVDGFSTDGTEEYCKALANTDVMLNRDIEFYQIPKKGLANAINYGIKKAGKLDVYLTQPDVIHFKLYGRDWLLEMYEQSRKQNYGIIIGLGGGGISGPTYIDGLQWAGTWNTYITRKAINKVGLFDENMSPGDDIDYSHRANLAKIKGGTLDFWVQHHRLTEHHGDDHELKIKMSKYFKKKWNLK